MLHHDLHPGPARHGFLRLSAIAFIFICTSLAWMFLGSTIGDRTYSSQNQLRGRVASTWGTSQEQDPPTALSEYTLASLEASRVNARIELEHRQKGLLWYATYLVSF